MFVVEFSSQARKFLKKTEKQIAKRIVEEIEKLTHDPFPSDVKRVVNRKEKIFRVRVGDYRIEHCPTSEEDTYILMFEPYAVQSKGD